MKFFEIAMVVLLCLSTVVLIGLQIKVLGFVLLCLSGMFLLVCKKPFAKDFLLICIGIAILGATPLSTDIGYIHVLKMGVGLMLALIIPYIITRYLYKTDAIQFRFHHGRKWSKVEISYVLISTIVAYLVLPFYFINTGVYTFWDANGNIENLVGLFIGLQIVGIWDELFFISTVLGIFKRHLPFIFANIAQSILFSSFLYTMGFRSWGVIMVFIFALTHGYIAKKTHSLFYILTIHILIDVILYLALLHTHHPEWRSIFLW